MKYTPEQIAIIQEMLNAAESVKIWIGNDLPPSLQDRWTEAKSKMVDEMLGTQKEETNE